MRDTDKRNLSAPLRNFPSEPVVALVVQPLRAPEIRDLLITHARAVCTGDRGDVTHAILGVVADEEM